MKHLELSALIIVTAVSMVFNGCKPGGNDSTGARSSSRRQYLSIAAGGAAGVYFPLAGSLAGILNKDIPGVTATAQSTGASVANMNLLGGEEVELAFVQNDIAYYAYTGTEMFDGRKIGNLRGVVTLYNEVVHLVATEGSGIRSIADLKGKSVAVGAPGSGTEANARQILAAFGMTYDDLGKTDFLSFGDAANNLKDGHVHAAFVTAGAPTAAVLEMSKTNRIRVIPVSGSEAGALMEKYPFYSKVVIPGATYDGQSEPVATVAVRAMIAVAAETEEEMVYNIVKALFSNLDSFSAAHARGRDLSLASSREGMSIPLHPGADKYYAEQK